ncbi:MAG: hypothetical protein OXH06_17270 [Gemmatimonadetes bacterium]|nr:hypothetical protein [Gemmatimonadota bacterium]MDE3258777.1 hypothetical protein [Gemmatimonadota bacterium]
MEDTSIEKDILEETHKLNVSQQKRVLEFARSLSHVQSAGIQGKYLLRFAGAIDKDNLEEIAQAIETGCERADCNEW